MTEREKLIEDRIKQVMPQLSENQQDTWLIIGETMVLVKNTMEENKRKEAELAK